MGIVHATMAGRPQDPRVRNRDKDKDKKETHQTDRTGLRRPIPLGPTVAIMTKDGTLYTRDVNEFKKTRDEQPLHEQLKELEGLDDEDIACGGGYRTLYGGWDVDITFQSGVCNGCSNAGQFTDKDLEKEFEKKIRKHIAMRQFYLLDNYS